MNERPNFLLQKTKNPITFRLGFDFDFDFDF